MDETSVCTEWALEHSSLHQLATWIEHNPVMAPQYDRAPGIMYEGLEPWATGDYEAERVIVVRATFPSHYHHHDFGAAYWHGTCYICQANLQLGCWCPCGLRSHDHCTSMYLKPVTSCSSQGIRVCVDCAGRLRAPSVISIYDDTTVTTEEEQTDCKQFKFTAMSGQIILRTAASMLPRTLAELIMLLKQCMFEIGNMPEVCLATDGYAYTQASFDLYYQTNALVMWQQAVLRTINMRVVMDANVMTPRMYDEFRQQWSQPSQVDAIYIFQLPAFMAMVPAILWPFEPIPSTGATTTEQHSWYQLLHDIMAKHTLGQATMLVDKLRILANRDRTSRDLCRCVLAYRKAGVGQMSSFLAEEAGITAMTNAHRTFPQLCRMIQARIELTWRILPGLAPASPTIQHFANIPHAILARTCPAEFLKEDLRFFMQLARFFPREEFHHVDHDINSSDTEYCSDESDFAG